MQRLIWEPFQDCGGLNQLIMLLLSIAKNRKRENRKLRRYSNGGPKKRRNRSGSLMIASSLELQIRRNADHNNASDERACSRRMD
eukprot:scaffold391505_cov20-Prasinocladus_malaysianus.AAC.2